MYAITGPNLLQHSEMNSNNAAAITYSVTNRYGNIHVSNKSIHMSSEVNTLPVKTKIFTAIRIFNFFGADLARLPTNPVLTLYVISSISASIPVQIHRITELVEYWIFSQTLPLQTYQIRKLQVHVITTTRICLFQASIGSLQWGCDGSNMKIYYGDICISWLKQKHVICRNIQTTA